MIRLHGIVRASIGTEASVGLDGPPGSVSHKPGGRLSLPFCQVTFTAAENDRPLGSNKNFVLLGDRHVRMNDMPRVATRGHSWKLSPKQCHTNVSKLVSK